MIVTINIKYSIVAIIIVVVVVVIITIQDGTRQRPDPDKPDKTADGRSFCRFSYIES